jgi:hypothetical protein
MSYAICLDQNTPNFNVNTLSPNGFSIYTNLDLQNPIYQGIPYTQLFQPPIGNCPFLVTIPQGATQLIVIDQCDPNLDVAAAIFSPTNPSAGQLTVECCYAIIDIPQGPSPSFCETCTLTFDTFLTSTTGSIIAGNLSSTCGPVTDYTIGWYLNGNYSAPAITSGFGNAFSYQFQHPLTGNGSVPVLAGNWEGIIHDITINGVTYSSVSGSTGGQSIPFESCFDTVVAQPLKCNNGAFQGIAKYTHQINFNSQAVGTTSAPVSLTFALDPTTKYFSYGFLPYSIDDEIEIKWKSGNPNATPSPNFYTQSIYLEKLKIGGITNLNPVSYFPFLGSSPIVNNIWPKTKYWTHPFLSYKRTLTLTSLPTSSNPLFPDLLEITITPNTTNNNTAWKAGFACLDEFDCTDCTFDNWPNSLPKIEGIRLEKQYGCDAQRLKLNLTGCLTDSDFQTGYIDPFSTLNGSLIDSYTPTFNYVLGGTWPGNNPYLSLKGSTYCSSADTYLTVCGLPSTGSITLNKIPNQIQLTFSDYNDYLHYKNALLTQFNTISPTPTSPYSCPAGSTSVDYYKYFILVIPIQGANANCGDNTTIYQTRFHINDYFNIQYVNDNNPNATSWSITIPQTPMVTCYPNIACDTCLGTTVGFINSYNSYATDPTSLLFTTNVGSKYQFPFSLISISRFSTSGASGSVCVDNFSEQSYYEYYSTYTIPFIPDASNPGSWINLPTLSGSIPCNTSPYLYETNGVGGASYYGYVTGYQFRFPHLTGSFDYSLSTNDFELYALTNITNTGSLDSTPNQFPLPCPEPSGSLIYSYIGGVPTVYTSSYFVGGSPTLIIDP